ETLKVAEDLELDLEHPRSQIISWIHDFPDLEPYKFEICGLCMYLKQRESGHDKFKFYKPTVIKNVIMQDASYSKINFDNLVNHLKNNNFIIPEKRSFKLTEIGERLYWKVKEDNYKC
ncbi:MAG: hypothetical protein ACFFBY_13810, partial [Promethearchaeota archaeon]